MLREDSGDHGALECEHSGSNIVYLMHFIAWLRFTAALNWCRFYLFLKKWKIKYFWNISSVKASEWPALPTCGFCSAVLNCHKAALVSGPSLVSLHLKPSVCEAESCDLHYLVAGSFGGNHALKMNTCNYPFHRLHLYAIVLSRFWIQIYSLNL